MLSSPPPSQSPYPEIPPASSVRDYLTVVFKHQKLFLTFFLSVLVVVTAVTFILPATYEVTASIMVKKSRAEIPLAPKESNQLIINQVTREDVNSEIEILKSRSLLETTLQEFEAAGVIPEEGWFSNLKSTVRASLGGRALTRLDKMVLELQENLEVQNVRSTNVIEVSYRSSDPEWATLLVQALTEQYLERRAFVHQPAQAVPFFEEQTTKARERLAEAEDALDQYVASAGLTVVEGPDDVDPLAPEKQEILEQLGDLQGRLSATEAEIEKRRQMVIALGSSLEKEPERLSSANRFNLDPATEEIETSLVALQLERDALIQDFKPDNSRIRDLDAQIALAEARLEEIQTQRGGINRTEISPVHQDLKSQLLSAKAQLAGARAEHAALQELVDRYLAVISDLGNKSLVLTRLRREAKAAEDTYLLYRKKHEEARISVAMNEQQIVDVAIAQPAQIPLKPVAPKKRLNLVLAVIVGILGGLGLTFLAEHFDHTFTTGEEVEKRLGIPLLASIPEHS